MENNTKDIQVKLYGLIPLKKKHFLIYEITTIIILVIFGIIFLNLSKPNLAEENSFMRYLQDYGVFIVFLAILIQVIEGLLYYNKFTSKQLKIIQYQQAQLLKSEEQLNELNKSKDKFFAIIAHDVKNPFTALLSTSQTLKQNFDLLDKNDLHQGINIINESSSTIYSLFENLLLWANSQMGNMQIQKENFNARAMVEEAVKPFIPAIEEKKISLNIAVDYNMV